MLKLPGMVIVKSSLELAYSKVVKTNKIGVSIKLTPFCLFYIQYTRVAWVTMPDFLWSYIFEMERVTDENKVPFD